MTQMPDTAYLIVGLFAAGMATILLWTDRASPPSRALAYCLLAVGARVLLGAFEDGVRLQAFWGTSLLATLLEVIAMIAGIGWARRIGYTAHVPLRVPAQWLFRIAQALVLVYGLMALIYLMLEPDQGTRPVTGVVRASGLEFALFAPTVGTSMLLSAIAILILMAMRIDKAERVRLTASIVATPFLVGGLVVNEQLVPVTVTIGLLIFLGGTVRYLMIQGQRGEFMSQFLSPDVARVVRAEGLRKALKRQRRPLSVVVCDLRGFTAYARVHDSHAVTDVLENFYDVIGEVVSSHGATVKDHAGDGVLILVGAPIPVKQHAREAVLLALELMERVQAMLRENEVELGVGVGIATGKTTVGAIRGAGRFEYVAVGNAVNMAARLCDRAEDGEILADQRTVAALELTDPVTISERAPERLKGFAEPVPVSALSVLTGTLPAPDRPPRPRKRRKTRSRNNSARTRTER